MMIPIKSTFNSSILGSWLLSCSGLLLLFCVVFYGIDYLTTQRGDLYHLYFDWELDIPFVPVMYIFYMSVLLLPFILPFLVSSPQKMRLWAMHMGLVIIIGGCIFLIFPATLGYTDSKSPAWLNLEVIQVITGTYNLVPSLHISLSLVTTSIIWTELKMPGKIVLSAWQVLMSISTLLTHQHHLLDVVSGILLVWVVIYSCQQTIMNREVL